jgi:uncharacterized protein YbcI
MLDGNVRSTIASEIVRLHTAYYGRGPTKAKTYGDGDVLVVVLEETFTRAERTLIERGEADGIQDIRRRFQRVMGDEFTVIVEEETGRKVRAFFSDTDVENDISVEIFILAEADP